MAAPVLAYPNLVKHEGAYRLGSRLIYPRPPETALATAYLRFRDEKLLELIFYDSVPSLSWFLETYQSADHAVLGCYRQTAEDRYTLEGLGWVNHLETMGEGRFRKAEVGMAFFRGVHGTLDYGRLGIEWAFNELKLNALYGTTPDRNPAAVAFARKLGFVLHGPVEAFCSWHGELCGAWISAMTRERWSELNTMLYTASA